MKLIALIISLVVVCLLSFTLLYCDDTNNNVEYSKSIVCNEFKNSLLMFTGTIGVFLLLTIALAIFVFLVMCNIMYYLLIVCMILSVRVGIIYTFGYIIHILTHTKPTTNTPWIIATIIVLTSELLMYFYDVHYFY